MPKEFIIRGQTVSGETEILNFNGYKPGYAYRLVEFQLYPGAAAGTTSHELLGTVTAGKSFVDPTAPDFNNEGLIASAYSVLRADAHGNGISSIVNDTFLITQNLILAVIDVYSAGSPINVNWQCRFVAEKMTGPEEAVANYKQFTIFDG
jgi:hypothetical protein